MEAPTERCWSKILLGKAIKVNTWKILCHSNSVYVLTDIPFLGLYSSQSNLDQGNSLSARVRGKSQCLLYWIFYVEEVIKMHPFAHFFLSGRVSDKGPVLFCWSGVGKMRGRAITTRTSLNQMYPWCLRWMSVADKASLFGPSSILGH